MRHVRFAEIGIVQVRERIPCIARSLPNRHRIAIRLPCLRDSGQVTIFREHHIHHAVKAIRFILRQMSDIGIVIVTGEHHFVRPLGSRLLGMFGTPSVQRLVAGVMQLFPAPRVHITYDITAETVYTEFLYPCRDIPYHIIIRRQRGVLSQGFHRRPRPRIIVVAFPLPFAMQESRQTNRFGLFCQVIRQTVQGHLIRVVRLSRSAQPFGGVPIGLVIHCL